jgi:hypothetical protein
MKIGQVFCSLTNKDIIISFANFGGSKSGGILGQILRYGEQKVNDTESSLLSYKIMMALMFDMPFRLILPNGVTTIMVHDFQEYYILGVKQVKLDQFANELKEKIKKATVSFLEDKSIKRQIDGLILILEGSTKNSSNVFIKMVLTRDYYEFHFFLIKGTINELFKIIKYFNELQPKYYYHAPVLFRNDWSKVCVIGSLKRSVNTNMSQYIEELKQFVQLIKIKEP